MPNQKMTLVDWLDDLCVRFIVNLPNEELQSVERICFQIEEAQWFYEDFIRPLDPNNLPSMHLRKFSQLMFQHCPLFSAYSEELHQQAYEQFLAYKTRVPVRGAIMLNEDMTHAVLVKGWKKGAKWSFPRGKINKEEADLDCAVREVYEETGFDLKEADLVLPDEQMKRITVTMREQSMMLYVFRGVPMDAYFEPRTRKEISKIDWYNLTDLPTLRRKNQTQQGAGADLIKESSFYMVAPFLEPLKSWIKQQHKLDRQKVRSGARSGRPPAITDDEQQPELDETTADEAGPISASQPDDSFADMVARLGRTHRPSDTLPELSIQPQAQEPVDPAAELKRLLSVGVQPTPVEAPSVPGPNQPHPNPLLALFQQASQSQGPQMPPQYTPFDQMMHPPAQTHSPHGQHHPRSHHMVNNGPPPPFPFPPHPQDLPIRGLPQYHNGMPPPMPPHFSEPPHDQMNNFQMNTPTMQQAFNQRHQQQPFQSPPDSYLQGHHRGPAIPPASNLPAPKLNTHTQGLLNAFKFSNQKPMPPPQPEPPMQHPAQQSSQTTPSMKHRIPQHIPHEFASPQSIYVPSPPQFHSQPLNSNFQPEQPKPRTAHQDSLLSLFSATPPVPNAEPAELSAHPKTPGQTAGKPPAKKVPDPRALEAFGSLPKKKGITTATVSGPINAPDFGTMKKNIPSPANQMPFMPQQILKRGQPGSAPRSPTSVTSTGQNGMSQNQNTVLAPAAKPTAHAQGLLDMFKGPSPQPGFRKPPQPPSMSHSPAPGTIDRPGSIPNEQKSTLLALFNSKPSPAPPHSHSPIPQARGSFPTSPKTTMSGVMSPVSPIPAPASGNLTASSTDLHSRSRISSIGESMAQSMPVPPTSHPTNVEQGELSKSNILPGLGAGSQVARDGKSPVDKNFLLGFLEDVARRGR